MYILEARNVTKVYGKGEAQVRALDGISVTIQRGEFTAIVGTSGSGKSTFLNLAGGLDVPTEGEIIVDGKNPGMLSEKELTIFRRRKIGFIFQQYNLIPSQLSGGQQQRVAIARALVTKPSLILADEPTGNLDSATGQDVLGLLKITGARFHQTILMITHNEEIAQLAERIIRIEDGRIV